MALAPVEGSSQRKVLFRDNVATNPRQHIKRDSNSNCRVQIMRIFFKPLATATSYVKFILRFRECLFVWTNV
jgi:hypothetical protein